MFKICFGFVLTAALLAAAISAAAQTARKTAHVSTSVDKTTTKRVRVATRTINTRTAVTRSGTGRSATTKSMAGRAATKTKGKGKEVAQAPPRQGQPTSDRYRSIQDALAAKGYLKSAPSGAWDQDSVDAMRRFQEAQKLEPTGKLNSRSLISLGLGPANQSPQPPATPPSATPPPK